MKKSQSLKALSTLAVMLAACAFISGSPLMANSPEGTWEYNAPSVPPEYQTGKLVINKTDDGYGATLVFSEYYQVKGEDVVLEGEEFRFKVYVEGEQVLLSGTFEEDRFTGTVEYSGGVVDITAKRVDDE